MTDKPKKIAHIRLERPKETDRNYDVLKEIWDFLTEEAELPFNPPFVARPPAGDDAQRARAIYVMSMGLEYLKQLYPKQKAEEPKQQMPAKQIPRADEAIF